MMNFIHSLKMVYPALAFVGGMGCASLAAGIYRMAEIVQIYISPGHNFVGHHGQPAGRHPAVACSEIECVAGQGLQGDRYFGHKDNYKGQATFFAQEVYEQLGRALQVVGREPWVFRRNIITQGLNLNELIGQRFWLGDVLFEGTEECRPCAWMDQAFAPGAEQWLRGNGGLRARILTDGILRRGAVKCAVAATLSLES
jgi:hypothetical protein